MTPAPPPVAQGAVTDERESFKAHYRHHFDLTEERDAWGQLQFASRYVDAAFYGWRDRAAIESAGAAEAQPVEAEAKAVVELENFRDKDGGITTSLKPTGAVFNLPIGKYSLYTHPQPVAAAGQAGEWRCFHCDEAFTDENKAAEHFGTHEHQRPACLIDAAEYRRMEAKEARYAEEDAACHRAMYAQQGAHALALVRAEEAGYAKGLRDSGNCPCATPAPVSPLPAVGDGCTHQPSHAAPWRCANCGHRFTDPLARTPEAQNGK